MGYHNLLSKNDRALVAYLVAGGAGTTADVVPAKTSMEKALELITIVHSERAREVAPYSGTYEVETSVSVRVSAVDDQAESDYSALALSTARVQATFDLLHSDLFESGQKLAEDITTAARAAAAAAVALGAADQTGNADLVDYSCLGLKIESIEQGQEEEGDAWVDSMRLVMVCCPKDVM